MERIDEVRRAVGRADLCELLSCAFAYPDERLVEGLMDGSLADDALACLVDAGCDEASARAAADGLRAWPDAGPDELLHAMRRTYTRLHLAPGGRAPIFPYESAFLHKERGLPGVPALFRTPVTLDVERQMREAGVQAKNNRKEPCDSVFEELEFLSYLYARLADALHCGEGESVAAWTERIRMFEEEHARAWLPSFMRRTQELADDGPYRALAALGMTAMGVLS
ncbi:TorD/DmsD family molecular chaperone [Arabiibacter massiliensis]|uniref:TorD/DmsD family molecular chaperone n=1 Tax=Arabiibacter massiliensis TaxID=1870985 RepID=UPI0009BAD7A9|nr:molecular chaperone TorD family protein [Arabiibacter massiliensis]